MFFVSSVSYTMNPSGWLDNFVIELASCSLVDSSIDTLEVITVKIYLGFTECWTKRDRRESVRDLK